MLNFVKLIKNVQNETESAVKQLIQTKKDFKRSKKERRCTKYTSEMYSTKNLK
jgi:hypothetical protein